jgi:hypothetical protein
MLLKHLRTLASVVGLGSIAIATSAIPASAEAYYALLSNGETETYTGYFLADENIYANCDVDCADLDIYLYDAYSGDLIDSDTLMDANPVVTAPYDGDFIVETVMVTCETGVCQAWTDSDHGF